MLTQQEAKQALAALAKEIVQLWNADGAHFHRRFLDADDLDVSDIIWRADSKDVSLSAAWSYMDAFLDAVRHGFKDLDGIPWLDAVALMKEVSERLTEGRPIEYARVLRYAPSEKQGCNPIGSLSRLFKPK